MYLIMFTTHPIVQRLVAEMQLRAQRIARGCYAENVKFTAQEDGLLVVVSWKNKGSELSWRKVFTPQEVLGDTSHLHHHAWQLQLKPCTLTRQIITAVLNQRGV